MAKSPNWLDVEHRPIENGAGDREIPAEGRIGWLSGKSRIRCYLWFESENGVGASNSTIKWLRKNGNRMTKGE